MKDGITLHPEHGLNPSIEVCMICGEDMGIALLGNNIKGRSGIYLQLLSPYHAVQLPAIANPG